MAYRFLHFRKIMNYLVNAKKEGCNPSYIPLDELLEKYTTKLQEITNTLNLTIRKLNDFEQGIGKLASLQSNKNALDLDSKLEKQSTTLLGLIEKLGNNVDENSRSILEMVNSTNGTIITDSLTFNMAKHIVGRFYYLADIDKLYFIFKNGPKEFSK